MTIYSKEYARKRSPAIADRTVWEKTIKGRAGVRWDYVVEAIRIQEETINKKILSIEKFDGYKTKLVERREEKERLALRSDVMEKHLEIYWGLREDIGMKTHLHGPMNYVKGLKLRF